MREWILDKWHEYARKLLMFAIFLPPVIFWRSTVDVFNLVKISALLAATSIALVFWVSYSAERGVWPPRIKTMYAALAFLAACAIGTIGSSNPVLSITGLYHRYGGLLPFALYFGVMLLIVGIYWERPDGLRDIPKASAWASLLLLGYVLIQESGQDWIEWRDASGGPPEFPVGTMGNSNFAGGYLGIALPFLVYMAFAAKRDVYRILLAVAVGLDILALWFTQTRGGMIAGAAGLFTLAFLNRHRLPAVLRIGTNVAAVAGVVVALVVFADVGSARTQGPLAQLRVFRTETLQVRQYYWGTAWRIFTDNPIIGTGLETYYANYPQYRLPEDGSELGLVITDKPHNIYLEYAANTGIIGIGTYLVLLGVGAYFGLRRLRDLEGQQRFLLATFLAVLAGYAAQGVFSIDVPPLAMMGWVALGGIAAIADPGSIAARRRLDEEMAAKSRFKGKKAAKQKASQVERYGSTRWPIHLVGVLAATLLLIFGLRPLVADARAKTAQSLESRNAPVERLKAMYESAVSAFPLEPTYRVQLGIMAEEAAQQAPTPESKVVLIREAVDWYQSALDLQQGNVFYLMNMARINALWGTIDVEKFKEADRWWKRAVEHDATDWEVHYRYGLFLNDWANAEADPTIRRIAVEELERTVAIKPSHLEAWINLGKIHGSFGETATARSALRKALELDPDNAEARQLLSEL